MLGPGDAAVLEHVAPDVFDHEVDATLTREFLDDSRHHIAVAVAADRVVGFASAVHYVHPDKAPQLFINEVGVAPSYRRRGVGRKLLALLLAKGEELGCGEAWVGTELENRAARGLYAAAGGVEAPVPFVMVCFSLRR